MKIVEKFYSLQGEGRLTGTPSVFIRLAGCPLRCCWCDTKYAWDSNAGSDYSIDQIINFVQQFPTRFVVITGGEPMIDDNLPELTRQLKALDKHITIETAGIMLNRLVLCDLMSISPKLSNSCPSDPKLAAIHNDSRLDIAVLGKLLENYDYQLKFVVDSAADLPEIQELVTKLNPIDKEKIMLMPQSQTRDELLQKSPLVADLCLKYSYTFCQRLHVLLWNNQKGK
jgi:7-carboxy-7-deazaguanine synthase